MAWKDKPMTGIVAAVLIIIGVIIVISYVSRSGPELDQGTLTFQCEAGGETFNVAASELNDPDVYAEYFGKGVEAAKCRLDGEMDAYRVYYCPVDKQYFKYTAPQLAGRADILKCPNGHEIPEENR